MSLYGALYAGVAGLQAQGNKLGIISDNIANVNTVGYKAASSTFDTLVTGANNATSYSPGGVISGNHQLVSQQGLLQTTSSPTDIALSGSGMFVVNQTADGTGQVLYTRAGSFTQDSTGNFINTAGYFLQALPLDHNGQLPGAPGNTTYTTSSANLTSLQTVNVQNLTGTASPTTAVSLGANLNAAQSIFTGAAKTAGMDNLDTTNFGIKANDIIVPTSVDSIVRGATMNIATGTNSTGFNFTYGGFAVGRSVSDGTGGDAATTLPSNTPVALANNPVTTGAAGSGTVTIALPNADTTEGLHVGSVVTLSGLAAVDGITGAELTGSFVVKAVAANSFDIDTGGSATVGGQTGGGAAGDAVVRPFAGNILDAGNSSQSFLGTTGTSGFTSSSLSFTITSDATGTVTFTYSPSSPNTQLGQFNNLTNLALAINEVSGLTARIVAGQLYVGATDANAAVTFANGSANGVDGPPVKAGIDWINELGLADVAAGTDRFSTLQSLADNINNSAGITATVENPLGSSDVIINVNDPLDTITFTDGANAAVDGSLLAELGLVTSMNSAAPSQQTTGAVGPAYDPTNSSKNMASGSVPAQFSRPINVFDAQGTSHNLTVGFLKIASNVWAVEIYAQPSTDVSTSDGLIASGNITFRGDGSLQSVDTTLTAPLSINWTTGASASTITMNWGTPSSTDGLTQFDSSFNVNFVTQNGAPVGQLTGVSIDADGFITASFNNGETQRLYKIPIAEFSAPDLLQSVTGNAFEQTSASGEVNLRQAGQSGVGSIASGALEASNVELANQLTDMIVAQRAYQANTKSISTANTLLDDLDQVLR